MFISDDSRTVIQPCWDWAFSTYSGDWHVTQTPLWQNYKLSAQFTERSLHLWDIDYLLHLLRYLLKERIKHAHWVSGGWHWCLGYMNCSPCAKSKASYLRGGNSNQNFFPTLLWKNAWKMRQAKHWATYETSGSYKWFLIFKRQKNEIRQILFSDSLLRTTL